ncbi:MAG: NINE protein [Gemmiger sp.]
MAKGKYRDKRSRASQPEEKTTWVVDEELLTHQKGTPLELADLDFEKQAARAAAGQEEEVYGFWGKIYKLQQAVEKRVPHSTVRKKTYLLLLVLLGWMGGHRYYERRWVLGAVYTAFFWTGIPLAMCLIDAMIVIPKKADENGMIRM